MGNKIKLVCGLAIAAFLLNGFFIWQSAPDASNLPLVGIFSLVAIGLMLWLMGQRTISEEQVHRFLKSRLSDDISSAKSSEHFEMLDTLLMDYQHQNRQRLESLAEQEKQSAQQAAKNMASLELATSMIMMADDQLNITFVNQSLKNMLSEHQATLAQQFSGFNVNTLIGTNIDVFHKNPAHQRGLLQNLSGVFESEISVGKLIFGLSISPLMQNNRKIGYMVQWQDLSDREELARLERESHRIKTSLDAVKTNVMLADVDHHIMYMNDSMEEMMRKNQGTFVEVFGQFNVNELIGTNIDIFHKDPSHQRNILDNLKDTFSSEVVVKDLVFGLVITPIFESDGTRLGTAVEWTDLTLAKKQEAQERSNARMKVALDNVSTNVMMANVDLNIIYLNNSLQEMMNKHVDKFKTINSAFDPNNLIGVNIDIFHKNPSHQRAILEGLTSTYKAEISLEGLYFALTANPVLDSAGQRIGTTLEWEDITEQKNQELIARANARIKVALDNVTTNVMVADHEYNIVYINDSVHAMLRNAAADLRKDLPNFDAENLIGQNIDIFHKNPAHQRSMLERLTSSYRTKILVGGRHFNLIATPVTSETGEKLGTVVEWDDITAQVVVEQEVEKLVKSVGQGQLGALISTTDKEGFFLAISEGLNELSQTVNAFVRDISVSLQRLSEGDLRVKIENDYLGMFGDVKESVNATVQKLNEVVSSIQSGAEGIRSSNREISQGNDQLSERTERQASSLEETAASLEELTSNVRQTADNSKTANVSASGAKSQAEKGEGIVREAMQSMSAITESSNRIVEIISVIDEIAFQTNLLALNASVEAARAGDQGRGFAVVANEVRNLAQRSAVSAKEIKELIDVSSSRVNTGSDLVNRCGEALSDILNHVDELSSLISGIASATNEQAQGIGEVNQAMAELDDITQQNAALSEEVSSAATSSLHQVEDMVERTSFFSVDDDANGVGSHMASSRDYSSSASKPATKPATKPAPKPVASKPLKAVSPPTPKPSTKPKPVVDTSKTVKPVSISSDKEDDDDEWEEF